MELNRLSKEQLKRFVFDYENTYISNYDLAVRYELRSDCERETPENYIKRMAKQLGLSRPPDFNEDFDIDMRRLRSEYESGVYKKSKLAKNFGLELKDLNKIAKKYKWDETAYNGDYICNFPGNIQQCKKCQYYDWRCDCCDYLCRTGKMRNCKIKNCEKFVKRNKESKRE